jgi:multidrug efflux pump
MAFVLGVLPLAIASGAGSASQRSIGTGVMAGMVSAVVLSVLFVPVFFVVVRRFFKGSERQRRMYAHELDEGAGQTAGTPVPPPSAIPDSGSASH